MTERECDSGLRRFARVAYCLLTHHHHPSPSFLPFSPSPSLVMPPASKASKSNGQKSITSFFRKPKKAGESSKSGDNHVDDDKSDDESAAEDKPAEDDVSEADAGDADEEQTKGSNAIDNSVLPPIHDTPAIFSDLVSHIPEIKGVAEHLKGRKMRVATMCSGTESPLLAFNLITYYIPEHFGVSLDWEHVFSCEIKPFKQAYIERNFQLPILFRDVCELGVSGESCLDRSCIDTLQNHHLWWPCICAG